MAKTTLSTAQQNKDHTQPPHNSTMRATINNESTTTEHHLRTDSSQSHLELKRGSYMSTHILLNILNELGKNDKMRGLPSILLHFRIEFDEFNNKRART